MMTVCPNRSSATRFRTRQSSDFKDLKQNLQCSAASVGGRTSFLRTQHLLNLVITVDGIAMFCARVTVSAGFLVVKHARG